MRKKKNSNPSKSPKNHGTHTHHYRRIEFLRLLLLPLLLLGCLSFVVSFNNARCDMKLWSCHFLLLLWASVMCCSFSSLLLHFAVVFVVKLFIIWMKNEWRAKWCRVVLSLSPSSSFVVARFVSFCCFCFPWSLAWCCWLFGIAVVQTNGSLTSSLVQLFVKFLKFDEEDRTEQNQTERHDIHSESPCHRVRVIVLCLFQPTWSSSSSSPFILFISFIFRWYDKDSGMCSFFSIFFVRN